MRLDEAIKHFLTVNQNLLSETTLEGYRRDIKAFSCWLEGRRPDVTIGEISREDIRAYRDYLMERRRQGPSRKYPSVIQSEKAKRRRRSGKLSVYTVHKHMRAVKRLFNFLTEEGMITAVQNPVLGVKNVTVPQMAMTAIPTEALQRLIKEARRPTKLMIYDARDAAITALMGAPSASSELVLSAGSGELARLKLSDIEEHRLYLVSKTFDHEPIEWPFYIEMTEAQRVALAHWLELRPECKTDCVFVSLDSRGGKGKGAPLQTKAIYSAYRKHSGMTEEKRLIRQEAIRHDAMYAARRLALLFFFLDTGARLGGICGLTLDRLDLEARQAIVIEKGDKTRTIFFSEATQAALAAWLEQRPQGDDRVFRIKPFRLRQMLDKLAEQAGIDAIHNPHSFRHTFAKMTIMNGADLSMVQRFLGHSSIKVTSDFYLHWDVEELARIHDQVSPVSGLEYEVWPS